MAARKSSKSDLLNFCTLSWVPETAKLQESAVAQEAWLLTLQVWLDRLDQLLNFGVGLLQVVVDVFSNGLGLG